MGWAQMISTIFGFGMKLMGLLSVRQETRTDVREEKALQSVDTVRDRKSCDEWQNEVRLTKMKFMKRELTQKKLKIIYKAGGGVIDICYSPSDVVINYLDRNSNAQRITITV